MTLDLAARFPCWHPEGWPCNTPNHPDAGPNIPCPGYSEPNFQEAVQRLVDASELAMPVIEYVSTGRKAVDHIGPYPDGAARRANYDLRESLRPFTEKGTE